MKNKLNIRKLIGWVLIIGLFLIVFVTYAIIYGLVKMLIVLAFVGLVVFWTWLGVTLIMK